MAHRFLLFLLRMAGLLCVFGLFTSGALSAALCSASPAIAPVAGSLIEKRWLANGGCAGKFGDPLDSQQRNPFTGGVYQDFEHGQIVQYDRWAGRFGTMPKFVLSAYAENKTIVLEWDSTEPFTYTFFNVRWTKDTFDESGAQQAQVTYGSTYGKTSLTVEPGLYRITIEGCVHTGWFNTSQCKQGWSHPVAVDVEPLTLVSSHTTSKPVFVEPYLSPLFDDWAPGVVDAKELESKRAVIGALCESNKVLETDDDHDHKGELKPEVAMALLDRVTDASIPCKFDPADVQSHPNLNTDPVVLRNFVNEKIRQATVVSEPGTDPGLGRIVGALILGGIVALLILIAIGFGSPILSAIAVMTGVTTALIFGLLICGDVHDYDMRLTGILRLRMKYNLLLDSNTKHHILYRLLTVYGPASERREVARLCGIALPFVPESENHILMTESSRYLTNRLLVQDQVGVYPPIAQPDIDNEQNGMNEWLLQYLQTFMQQDFYEYNARPYTFMSRMALQNLAEFASWGISCPGPPSSPLRECAVRRAARNILDYQAAKFAVSTSGLRRVAPFRRKPERKDYPYLLGRASDDSMWSQLTYTHGSQPFWRERHGRPDMEHIDVLAHAYEGHYLPSPVIRDLMGDDIKPALLPASMQSMLHRFYFERDGHVGVEMYYKEPDFLIAAGGVHDDGRGSTFSGEENGRAMSTVLIPAVPNIMSPRGKVELDRRALVRIDGSSDEDERANTCVAPGFACGENPRVPDGIPSACLLIKGTSLIGKWTFIDFAGRTSGCDLQYSRDLFVVVYEKDCSEECEERFGFFEAVHHRTSLEELAEKVIGDNGGWNYRDATLNIYKGASGRTYTFVPVTDSRTKWGIINVANPINPAEEPHVFEREIRRWPLADGPLMRSPAGNDGTQGHDGCVIIDNPRMKQRLILDNSDWKNPRRTRVWLPTECGCPLHPSCLPPRYDAYR